jgi:hypothetical protein
MALTVRPDDEVYQFDTVWLGPDEYTLPIQARYVAWGTWLACFLVAAVVLIPLGGNGPAGVFGSLIWSLGLSVVLSRAVMLVVDHERPLRSLPALFSAEARAALAARRRAERALLVRPGKIRVRDTPPKVLAMRERQRGKTAARADRKRPAPLPVPVVAEIVEPDWVPETIDHSAGPTPAWSIPTDVTYDSDTDTYAPVPVTYGAAYPSVPNVIDPGPGVTEVGRHAAHEAAVPVVAAAVTQPAAFVPVVTRPPVIRPNPFRSDPHHPEAAIPPETHPEPYRGPVTVSPNGAPAGKHARPAREDKPDGQAALEARILLPARKDR